MTAEEKNRLLEKARFISLIEKRYEEALALLDHFLARHKNDLDALCLKGNILDLKGLDCSLELNKTEIEKCFTKALKCYNTILTIDSKNTNAMIDIGDYWERKCNHQEALKWYSLSINIMQKINNDSLSEELNETSAKRQKILEILSQIKGKTRNLG